MKFQIFEAISNESKCASSKFIFVVVVVVITAVAVADVAFVHMNDITEQSKCIVQNGYKNSDGSSQYGFPLIYFVGLVIYSIDLSSFFLYIFDG